MDEKIDEPHQLMFESERYLKAIIESSIDGIQKWDTIQKGIPDDFEIGITTKSGIIKYVRVAHKLTIIDGKNKVVSVTKNITENKELESFLKESEAKYRDLFDYAQDAMYVLDKKGNVLMKNTEVIEIISKNGEHRWIEIKTRPIMDNGKIVEVHGIGRDVTENKKLKLN